jgi:hypothetical protein
MYITKILLKVALNAIKKKKKKQKHKPLPLLGVKPLIHQSELGTYTKVVPFQEKSSFHFVRKDMAVNKHERLSNITHRHKCK